MDGQEISVRELGGAILAELVLRARLEQDLPEGVDRHVADAASYWAIDLIMGIVARYDGYRIYNDRDLPVVPTSPYFENANGPLNE